MRKACVDYIVEISQLCEPKVRESILTPIFLKFFTDINKWVKISAYKNLGPFISTLAGLEINESLLKHYYEMIESSVINLSGNNEVISKVYIEKYSEKKINIKRNTKNKCIIKYKKLSFMNIISC